MWLFAAACAAAAQLLLMRLPAQLLRPARCLPAARPAAVVGAGIVWPTLHERSYLRWRTAAVGIVRLLIMSMPTNYNTALFDAMTPALATGRFAGLINLSTILLGGRLLRALLLGLRMVRPRRGIFAAGSQLSTPGTPASLQAPTPACCSSWRSSCPCPCARTCACKPPAWRCCWRLACTRTAAPM